MEMILHHLESLKAEFLVMSPSEVQQHPGSATKDSIVDGVSPPCLPEVQGSYPTPPVVHTTPHEADDFDDFLTPASLYAQAPAVDECDRYKSLNPIKDAFRKPIEWWKDHLDEYPTIFRMALDFFSVPAMSAECKRVFSLAKIVLATQRQHMNETTLEALVCLKLWWKANVFTFTD